MRVLGVDIEPNATRLIIAYQFVLLAAFTVVYRMYGITANFKTPEDVRDNWTDCMYFAATVASTVGFGDITPKSKSARVLCTLHILLTWIPTLVIYGSGSSAGHGSRMAVCL